MTASDGNMKGPIHALSGKDVVEIVVGSLVLAFPVATTEEIWNMSAELSFLRMILLSFGSLVIISIFVYSVYDHEGVIPKRRDFYSRVGATYGVTIVICALLLMAVDRMDLAVDPGLAIKRTILVAFPASFAATVVDSLS